MNDSASWFEAHCIGTREAAALAPYIGSCRYVLLEAMRVAASARAQALQRVRPHAGRYLALGHPTEGTEEWRALQDAEVKPEKAKRAAQLVGALSDASRTNETTRLEPLSSTGQPRRHKLMLAISVVSEGHEERLPGIPEDALVQRAPVALATLARTAPGTAARLIVQKPVQLWPVVRKQKLRVTTQQARSRRINATVGWNVGSATAPLDRQQLRRGITALRACLEACDISRLKRCPYPPCNVPGGRFFLRRTKDTYCPECRAGSSKAGRWRLTSGETNRRNRRRKIPPGK